MAVLIPVVIEIEPVVGVPCCVEFEALHEIDEGLFAAGGTLGVPDLAEVGQLLDDDR